jgi:hypothetical protein
MTVPIILPVHPLLESAAVTDKESRMHMVRRLGIGSSAGSFKSRTSHLPATSLGLSKFFGK